MSSGSALDCFRLDGKVAAITGAARGIGLATATLFAEAGARLVLIDKDREAVDEAAARFGERARGLHVDVADEGSVEAAFSSIAAMEGRCDVLVNNAGIAIRKPTLDLQLDDWQRVLDVNMTGVFLCARAAARLMLAHKAGSIVNMASIMGLSGGGLYPNISYQATKGALVNMTRALAVEWAREGLRVNAVAPTWVDTELIAPLKANEALMAEVRRMTPAGRLAAPVEVARACLFLAGPASSMVTGAILPVDGGFLAQ